MADKEVLGQNEVFDAEHSNIQEEISVDKAKAQEAEAEKVREAEGE